MHRNLRGSHSEDLYENLNQSPTHHYSDHKLGDQLWFLPPLSIQSIHKSYQKFCRIFFLAECHSLQVLNSPTRDGTDDPCNGSAESYPLGCQRSPYQLLFYTLLCFEASTSAKTYPPSQNKKNVQRKIYRTSKQITYIKIQSSNIFLTVINSNQWASLLTH